MRENSIKSQSLIIREHRGRLIRRLHCRRQALQLQNSQAPQSAPASSLICTHEATSAPCVGFSRGGHKSRPSIPPPLAPADLIRHQARPSASAGKSAGAKTKPVRRAKQLDPKKCGGIKLVQSLLSQHTEAPRGFLFSHSRFFHSGVLVRGSQRPKRTGRREEEERTAGVSEEGKVGQL
jgi:hypothetical protein